MLHDRRQLPPRLRVWNPLATPAVEAVIHRCLEPDPARRYQTPAELHEDLERHLKQLPLRHTREPSLRERSQKWTRRHSRLTAVIAVGLVVTGAGLAVGAYQEDQRIAAVEAEVAGLMHAGRQALDAEDADVAHGRFLAAWMKVQAEPSLIAYYPGVAGWLDHSRRAVVQKQWKQRLHPREYDERRDEALLLSLLLEPHFDQQVPTARTAIHAALDLTIPGDPGWTREREQLMLVEADLIALESGAEQALKHLDAAGEFSSREFHDCRARLLEQLDRRTEADQARETAAQFPPSQTAGAFLSGVSRARRREFAPALHDFEQVLEIEPESFTARLFQGICFLELNRPGEARVALTSCMAQRPDCLWSGLFRSRASAAQGNHQAALVDLQRVLDTNPVGALESAALMRRESLRGQVKTSSSGNPAESN
jgi:tetratricopeptide (TPR) repeat protein